MLSPVGNLPGGGGGGATWYQPCPYVCVETMKDMGHLSASNE